MRRIYHTREQKHASNLNGQKVILVKRINEIESELENIDIFDSLFVSVVKEYYLYENTSISQKDVSNIYKFIKYVLSSYGYNSEEMKNFMIKNPKLFCTTYNELVSKISILHHFGYFEEVFFENNDVLNSKDFNVSVRDLYAYLNHTSEIDLKRLKGMIFIIPSKEKANLRDKYRVTSEIRDEYFNELKEFLSLKKKENVSKRKDTI